MPLPLARLNDFEDMLVSRIHPPIQVFTLFPIGQLAYVWAHRELPPALHQVGTTLALESLRHSNPAGEQETKEAAGVGQRRINLLQARKCFVMH